MRPSTEVPAAAEVPTGPWDLPTCLGVLERALPRVLSQIDRDPDSPTLGSCDRGFWMYRLHDFDSGVVQQAGLTLACVAALVREQRLDAATPNLHVADPAYLEQVARAVNSRTATLLARNGFLDEYFPGEQSYPGTVFAAYATLSSAIMLGQTEVAEHAGLRATAERLLARAPGPAANQDVAAASFLALYAKQHGWRRERAKAKVRELLLGPDGSGRCLEYGGGDLGYASVSLAYMGHMLADESHDCGEQLDRLAGFIADFVGPRGQLGGEYASRSTTYWLPFGLLMAARRSGRLASALALLDLASAYERLDDRYLMHYCLPALARTALEVGRGRIPVPERAEPAPGWQVTRHPVRGLLSMRKAGHAVFVGLHKGGSFEIESARAAPGVQSVVDVGYRIRIGGDVYATCVLDPAPELDVDCADDHVLVRVRCGFRRYRTLVASPNKTLALRVARVLGPDLNEYFRQRLITDAELLAGPRLERTLRLDRVRDTLEVEDAITGLGEAHVLTVAPPVSLRLVPSARFWQAGEAAAFARMGPAPTRSTRRFALSAAGV